MTDEAKTHIISEGTDLDLGARPLRRAIERVVEDPLAEELLKGAFKERPNVTLRIQEGKIWFDTTEEPPDDVEMPDLTPPGEEAEEEEEPVTA